MDAFEAIRRRCSVREFAAGALSRETIEKIVDCGRRAPTARKEEPWEFVVVTDRTALGALAAATDHGTFMREASCAIIVVCRQTKYYLEDGCAATENILLAATALGLGACWVAGDKKPYCAAVLELCGAPSAYRLVSIVAIGHPARLQEQTGRRPLADLIHWERY